MEQTFGQELRQLRKSKSITQRELATKTGVDLSYISKVEKGNLRPPAADTIVKMCGVIGVPPDRLLVLAGKMPNELIKTIGSSAAALEFVRHAQSMGLSEDEWQNLTGELRRLRKRKITDLQPGEHVCCIYDTEEEHKALVTSFLRRGLERHEKVFYITDAHTAETILNYLREDGLEVEPYLTKGQLNISNADGVYIRGGIFNPDAMLALLRSEIERALSEGYSALRVTGEMSWALRGLPGSERLLEYENKLNTFYPGSQCLGICQYDRRRFDAALLLDVVIAHPTIVLGTEIHSNPFYVPPTELLGKERSVAVLFHRLNHVAMPAEQPKAGN
jgi:transcriptional regulator with XRE-family HTH domain